MKALSWRCDLAALQHGIHRIRHVYCGAGIGSLERKTSLDRRSANIPPGERTAIAPYRRRRTTLADVAALAGVSQVTASRALRRPDMVSADLRARVEHAAGELAYVRNHLASAL